MDDMDAVYRTHAQTVYKFLLAQCHDPDLAEELTQETFYQAVRSIGRFDGSCKLSVWLCQIAKHLWYQYLRKRQRDPVPLESTLETSVPSAEDGVLEQEGRLSLLAADPPVAGVAAGGGLPPGLWKSQLPGDRGCAGKDGELGQSDLLPEQGKTQEWRRE